MENWALSDQCWLQALQFLVHLIDFLSILLRCNGFTGIQKAVVDQMGSRPPNSDRDPLFGVSLALGSALGFVPGPATELVITDCRIKSISLTHHNSIEKWFVLVTQNKRR